MTNIELSLPGFGDGRSGRGTKFGRRGVGFLLLGVAVTFVVVLSVFYRVEAAPLMWFLFAILAAFGVFAGVAAAAGFVQIGGRPASTKAFPTDFLDLMGEGVVITDAHGVPLYANKAYRELTGSTEEALRPLPDFFGGIHTAEPIFRLSRAAQRGESWSEEFRVPKAKSRKAGDALWYRVSVRPLPMTEMRDTEKEAHLTLWEVADISQERQRQEAAFAKLQEIIDYLDHAPAGFFSADEKGRIDYLNATLAQWLGLDLAELVARDLTLSDIVAKDGVALLEKAASNGESEGATQIFDIDLIRHDGTPLPVRLLHRVDGWDKAAGYRSRTLVLNRAPGTEHAEDLRAAEVRYARLFHSSPIAVATIDEDGHIGSNNAAFARMFLASRSTPAGSRPRLIDYLQKDDHEKVTTAIRNASQGRLDIAPIDVTFGEKGDRNARLYISPIDQMPGERESAILYAIDTTKEHALKEQMVRGRRLASVGEFVVGISHNFNNVLQNILSQTEALLANLRPTDPDFSAIIAIRNSAKRAAGLTRQLQAHCRQLQLRAEMLNLNDLLPDLDEMMRRPVGERIRWEFDYGRDLWLVKVDRHEFLQVLINLVSNARDAMPDGGTLSFRTANVTEKESRQLALPGMTPGEYVLCEVRDTGTGMPPEVLEKIFDPFFTTKDVGKGTGMGLASVYGTIKQTGGYIFPFSEPGKGTTFQIYLPRYIPTSEELAEEEARREAQRLREQPRDLTGSETILIVEDEEGSRNLSATYLSKRGYRVLEAGTGREALDIMAEKSGEIDLVISDVMMPEMDGPTMFLEMRKRNPNIKVIFISGYAEMTFRQALNDDNITFLAKPYDMKSLLEAVKDELTK